MGGLQKCIPARYRDEPLRTSPSHMPQTPKREFKPSAAMSRLQGATDAAAGTSGMAEAHRPLSRKAKLDERVKLNGTLATGQPEPSDAALLRKFGKNNKTQ